MRAWLKSSGDFFKEAQYERFCRDGSVFSIVLLVVVPIVTLTVAFMCCCCTTANGIKNGNAICEDDASRHREAKRRMRTTRANTVKKPVSPSKPYGADDELNNSRREKKIGERRDTDNNTAEVRVETDAPMMTEGGADDMIDRNHEMIIDAPNEIL